MKIKKLLLTLVAGVLAVTTLTSVYSFGSFADTDVETLLIPFLNCKVMYQTKQGANGGTDIRFVAEVKDEDILYADSAEWYIEAATADTPEDFMELETQAATRAYKSLNAGGKTVTAPKGCSYIISKQVGSFSDGDRVYGEIFLSGFANFVNRIAEISNTPTPDSSSEDESSEVIDESSKTDDESSEIIDDSSETIDESSESGDDSSEKGAAYTGNYRNLFAENGKSEQKIQKKLNDAFQQLFYGTDGKDIINEGKRVYYPVGDDMAYIYDTGNDDVRSEGMSYGMMIAVQMDKKEEFDRLWKWAKTYMYHSSGERKGMFAWQCTTSGSVKDDNCAPDGEEYFATALLFASARWGDGEGIYNYRKEALNILSYMLYVNDRPGYQLNTAIDPVRKMVVFVPYGSAAMSTDPSYHLPAFYEIFARESTAKDDKLTWLEVAETSREFFKKCTHPTTGLSPDYATFEGEGCGGHQDYAYDAWRVPMNIAMDYSWWQKDEWQVEYANRIQSFFYNEGISTYMDNYTVDGTAKYGADHSIGPVSCNAVASLAADHSVAKDFVDELWKAPIPEGKWRYYNGMLYMLSLLNVSGNYRVYLSENATLEIPPEIEETLPDGTWTEVLNHTQGLSNLASLYTKYSSSSNASYNQYGPESTKCIQVTGGGSSAASGIKIDVSDLFEDGDYAKAEFKIRVTGAPESIRAFMTDDVDNSVLKYAGTNTLEKDQWLTYTTHPVQVKSENGKTYFCVTNNSGYWYIYDVVLYKLDVAD